MKNAADPSHGSKARYTRHISTLVSHRTVSEAGGATRIAQGQGRGQGRGQAGAVLGATVARPVQYEYSVPR